MACKGNFECHKGSQITKNASALWILEGTYGYSAHLDVNCLITYLEEISRVEDMLILNCRHLNIGVHFHGRLNS